MWAIDNRTPYRAGKSWTRDRDGVHLWIVSVKATYDILPDGRTALAEEQLAPLIAPEYRGEPGLSSLRHDAELVAQKPTTDILVNGHAHAPGGRPSANFTASLRVASVHKTLRVRGDRHWEDGAFGGKASQAEPLSRIPLTYERAFGGHDRATDDPRQHRIDLRNPVGCGLATAAGGRVGTTWPNFEYPNGNLEKAGPAGFGAIDGHWSPRRELMGTYDAAWQATRLPLLPTDWDPQSLQCAPADQRPAQHLRGGEPVELVNLSAEGLLRFDLPRVHLAFTTRIDGRFEEHRAQLSTVTIEPDLRRLLMVWTTSLACRNDADYLEETTVREKRLI